MKLRIQIFTSIGVFIILVIINVVLFKSMSNENIVENPNFWSILGVLLTQVISYIVGVFNTNSTAKNTLSQSDYISVKENVRKKFDSINEELIKLEACIKNNKKYEDNVDFKEQPSQDILGKISSSINDIEIDIGTIITSKKEIESILTSYYKAMNDLYNYTSLGELQKLRNVLKQAKKDIFSSLQERTEKELGLF